MDLRRVCVLALVSTACISDLRSGRVRNWIAVLGWAVGAVLALAGAERLPAAMADFLAGAVIPLTVGFFLYKGRLLGAGDAKLFSAVGGITGLHVFCRFAVWSFILGGILSFLILISGDNGRQAVLRLRDFAGRTARTGRIAPYRDDKAGKGMFHFTVPMLMAAVMYAGGMI